MYQCRKRSLALAVALALCASGALAATPPHALPDSRLDNVPLPLPGRLNIGAPMAATALGNDGALLAISQARASVVMSCTPAAFAAAPLPSAMTEWCLDDALVPPRDPLDMSPQVSASALDADSTWFAISPAWTNVVALSIPAATTEASSRGIPDLRPDNSPVPPTFLLNIWAPVSAGAPGGSGTWSLTSTTWTDINGDAPAAMSPQPGFAKFQGIPGLVTVDDSAGAIGVTGMRFAVDGYTLTGDALQLAGSAGSLDNVDVGDGTSASAVDRAVINNALTGSAGLNKVDFGTLVLAGNNTYSGGTTISSGTLQIGNGGSSGSIIGNVTDNGLLTFDRSDAVNYGGVISGDGSLTQASNGILKMTGVNTYTGVTNVNSGTLALLGNGSISDSNSIIMGGGGVLDISGATKGATVKNLQGGGLILLGGKSLTVSNDASFMYWGIISGSGGLTVSTGNLELLSANTYTGLTTIDQGAALQMGNGAPGSVAGDILNNGALTYYFNHADLTYSGVISGTGALSKIGTGTLTLTGANTFTGGVLVVGDQDNGGKLAVSSDANLGAPSSEVNLEGGWLEATASFTLAHTIYLYDLASSIQVDAGATLTVANPITGDEYPFYDSYDVLLKTGAGTLVLAGNNTYGGHTSILEGTLALTGAGSLAASSGLTDYATFDISGTTNGATIQNLLGDGAITLGARTLTLSNNSGFGGVISGSGGLTLSGGTTTLSGTNTYTGSSTIDAGAVLQVGNGLSGFGGSIIGDVVDNGSLTFDRYADMTYTGAISGTGSVTQMGTGTLTLTGANTYSGGTNINGSVLQVSSDANLGATSVINDGTGLVTIDNGTLQAGGPFTLSHQIDIENTGYMDTNGYAVTLAGSLMSGGTATFAKEGSGTLTFVGYAGTCCVFTNVDAGTLAISGGATLGGSLSVAGGATFDISQTIGNPFFISALDGNGTVALGSHLLYIEDYDSTGIFGGVIADGGIGSGGGGGVTVDGNDFTWTLAGVNTYTGPTNIYNGTLALTGNGSIANSSSVDVYNGGTLDISGTATGATIKSLLGNGNVVLGEKTLTVNDSQGTNWFSGVISGAGGLMLSGGTLTLTGANTYSGGTTVDAGATLQLGNSGPGGSVVGDILDNGSVTFEQGTNVTYGGAISGTGSLMQDGTNPADTLTLTGTNTYSGVTEIFGGRLQVGDGGTSGSLGTGLISDFGELVFDRSDNVTFGGNITGDGSLEQSGTGALILAGINTFTGGVTINAGTLQATTMLPGDVVVNSGGTLDAVPGVGGNLGNAGKVTVHGGDTALSGTYTNASTGTLAVSLGSKLAVNGTATLNGGTLEVTGADPGYVANTHTDVLTASGGVTGTFDNLVKDSGVVFTSTTIGYGTNDVYLDTTGLSITAAAKAMGIVQPAAMSAAQRVQDRFEAINATMASGGTPSSIVLQGAGAIQRSATPAVAQATLTSLSGQLHAASAAMLFDGIDARSNALSEHFDDLVGGRTNSGVWYGDLGWQGNLQRGGYSGATFRSDGGMAGADVRVGAHGVFGFAAGQSRGFGQLDASWDHNRTWMNSLAMYGGVVNGSWYASAQIANGWYREDMQRLLQLGALGSPVGTASTGRYSAGALEGGRLLQIGTVHIEPFADIRYQRLELGGFTEQGGLGYGLMAESHTAGRLQTGLGLRAKRGWELANGLRMEFDGSAGWQHTLHQYGNVFDASFTGFNDWLPVEGIGLSRNTAILRTGLSLWPSRNIGLRLGYMYEQDQQERAGSAMLQGTVTF